ncbi:MAG: UbiX family flavin prenyltransferase [Rhodospirillaceae bacterium]|nr:UbiX family flavin prenyltransferase [Rhodospirillaceae bacterium]MBL6930960.1 UbiX family flavin prenyltransferase [Rhodospirillales bacterium]MBL6940727.1 UbiX family flavin prenyltransferase [Rhodospirillales bacterium]
MSKQEKWPVIVGISGATGIVYGVEALRTLNALEVPVHLIISEAGVRTLELETDLKLDDLRPLAQEVHNVKDIGASIASGSFRTRGMIVAPCSIKTLSGIANSFDYNLLIRAADVTLKERRPLILLVRETPLHKGHLELMARASDYGATIMPPVPAFYNKPKTIDDIVRQTVGRALDHLGLDHDRIERWNGGRD